MPGARIHVPPCQHAQRKWERGGQLLCIRRLSVYPLGTRSAVSERAPDYQRGDPLGNSECVSSLSPQGPAPDQDADGTPSMAVASRAVSHEMGPSQLSQTTVNATSPADEDAPNLPGHIHKTYYMLQVDRYVFCGVCGAFAMQIRRSRLHMPCPREPRNRYAKIARDKLLEGREPEGRGWRHTHTAVVPLTEE